MNTRNLKKGMKIKNYKEMCKILEVPENKNGSGKQAQQKDWERYFEYEKDKQSFIIIKVYKKPKDKIKNNYKKYDSFQVDENDFHKKGVYSIILNNCIYIGSTTLSFRKRFLKHINKVNLLCTKQMLKDGANFNILWIANDNDSEDTIRTKETEFINKYRQDSNWIVKNSIKHNPYVKGKLKFIKKYKKIYIHKNDMEKVIQYMKDNNIFYKENSK